MGDMTNVPAAVTNFFQKRVANPLMRRMPFQTLLETTGRMHTFENYRSTTASAYEPLGRIC
jgi:hypothetical protein